jgi:hypothetical protein
MRVAIPDLDTPAGTAHRPRVRALRRLERLTRRYACSRRHAAAADRAEGRIRDRHPDWPFALWALQRLPEADADHRLALAGAIRAPHRDVWASAPLAWFATMAVCLHPLRNRDQVATRIVEHGGRDRSHRDRRLRELDAEALQALVVGANVLDRERRVRDAVGDGGLLERTTLARGAAS